MVVAACRLRKNSRRAYRQRKKRKKKKRNETRKIRENLKRKNTRTKHNISCLRVSAFALRQSSVTSLVPRSTACGAAPGGVLRLKTHLPALVVARQDDLTFAHAQKPLPHDESPPGLLDQDGQFVQPLAPEFLQFANLEERTGVLDNIPSCA